MFSPPRRVSDPDMHHGSCVTHVPWSMPESLTCGFLWSWWQENVPGIPDACATRSCTYLGANGATRFVGVFDSINQSSETRTNSYISSNPWYKANQIQKLECFSSGLAVVFTQSIKAVYEVENEDAAGEAPTGDTPTTSEWSTMLLPTKLRLVLEVCRYIYIDSVWLLTYCNCQNSHNRQKFRERLQAVLILAEKTQSTIASIALSSLKPSKWR